MGHFRSSLTPGTRPYLPYHAIPATSCLTHHPAAYLLHCASPNMPYPTHQVVPHSPHLTMEDKTPVLLCHCFLSPPSTTERIYLNKITFKANRHTSPGWQEKEGSNLFSHAVQTLGQRVLSQTQPLPQLSDKHGFPLDLLFKNQPKIWMQPLHFNRLMGPWAGGWCFPSALSVPAAKRRAPHVGSARASM